MFFLKNSFGLVTNSGANEEEAEREDAAGRTREPIVTWLSTEFDSHSHSFCWKNSLPLSISLYSPYSLHSIPPLKILLCLFSPSLFPFSPSLLFCPPSLCSRYCYKDTVPLDPTSWFFYQTNISDPLTRSPGRRKVQFFCEHCAVR